MSTASKIRDYLTAQPIDDEKGYRPLDLDKMAGDLKIPKGRLSSHLSAMAIKGKIEMVRDDRRYIGVAAVHNEDRRKTSPKMGGPRGRRKARMQIVKNEQVEPRPVRRLVETPELERVLEARSAMRSFIEQFPGMVDEARANEAIRIDPDKAQVYADEGLRLLERNHWLERRNRELREENESLKRADEYRRLRESKELQQGLAAAGVTVKHGD